MVTELAEADPNDRIKTLQEVYLDYYAVGRNLFSLKIPSTIALRKPRERWGEMEKSIVNRSADGLISAVMSLRLLPQVKYLTDSNACA